MSLTRNMRTSYFEATPLHNYARVRVMSDFGEATYYPCDILQSARANHITAVNKFASERDWHGQWLMVAMTGKGFKFIECAGPDYIDI